jgi:hypothetical protein
MVAEYSTKRLSFQTDIEYAFSGLASILTEWCDECPVINGMLSRFFGQSMLWYFSKNKELRRGGSHIPLRTWKRREGFPSWSWVGWNACVSNMKSFWEVQLPPQSLVRNVEITCYSQENAASRSLIVLDKSVTEDRNGIIGQHIRINLETAKFDPNAPSSNTLGFDAERIEWKYFTVEGITKNSTIKNTTAPGPKFRSRSPWEIIIIRVWVVINRTG